MFAKNHFLTSRRLAAVGLPLLAFITGSATPGVTAATGFTAKQIAVNSHACPAMPAEADALSRAGAPAACAGVGPERYADLAELQHQMVTREYGPFTSVAPGAYQHALAQRAALLPAGTYPGTANLWAPAGHTPDCDGQTADGTTCPLSNQTNVQGGQPNTGDYSISSLGHRELSGRVTGFAGDPANVNHVWLSNPGGGVWETTDGGGHWRSIGDGLATEEIGAIAYSAPTHTLLAGSGDNAFGGDSVSGHDIYWTTDDGATWNNATGIPDGILTFRIAVSPADASGRTVYAATSRGLFRSNDAGRSWINENLPSAPSGYTVPDPTQGGKQVSCQGNTTAPLCFFANMVTDVVVKGKAGSQPAGAVMAVLGWRAGPKPDTNQDGTVNMTCQSSGSPTACLQAPQNGIYLSTDGSPGSFTFQSHPTASATGMDFAANAIVGRTSLGIADGPGQNNDYVVAMVEDAGKFNRCVGDALDTDFSSICQADVQALGEATVLDGAYETSDFGAHWVKIMDWSQLRNGSGALLGAPGYAPGVQSWYNNWIKPDPSATDASGNPSRVLFGLEEVWENNPKVPSTGAGGVLDTPWLAYAAGNGPSSAWADVGRYWNDCGGFNATGGVPCDTSGLPNSTSTTTTHPDQHAELMVPDGSGGVYIYVGNDGGAYVQHVTSGSDVSNNNWGDGIDVGLYTLQPYDASISGDGTIVAGLQDNGETKIAKDGSEQHTIFGGDGFMTMIDPTNSNNIIEEYVGGATSISLDGGKNWYGIAPSCNAAGFSTPLEQDTAIPGHVVEGCSQVYEAGAGANVDPSSTPAQTNHNNNSVFEDPCSVPPANSPGENPATCQLLTAPWQEVVDLGLATKPLVVPDTSDNGGCNDPRRGAPPPVGLPPCVYNVPSAVNVVNENIYVGYCGYCDVVTGGLPFRNGIATNAGGTTAKIGSPDQTFNTGDQQTKDGWHVATANCAGCGSADGKLPSRLITSIQQDPANPRTVYVTLGGYGRHWIPPGALGDDVSKVGNGHVFVSYDAGENFTDISGNLPDVPANFTMLHKGQLLVATDIGVYVANSKAGGNYAVLGSNMPTSPVFTLRAQPGKPDVIVAATYGRGVYKYDFASAAPQPSPTATSKPTPPVHAPSPTPTAKPLPNTGFRPPSALLLLGILGALMGGAAIATRNPRGWYRARI